MVERPDELRRQDPAYAGSTPEEREEILDRARDDDEVAQTRAEIEQTRADMGETVDALQDRLSPENIRYQAKEQVRETARETGSGFMNTVKQNPIPTAMVGVGVGWLIASASGGGGNSGGSSSGGYSGGYQGGSSDVYYGSAYGRGSYDRSYGSSGDSGGSSMEEVRGRAGEAAGQAQERMSQMGGQAQERANQAGQQAQQQAQRAKGGFQRMMRENPLALGAAVLGIGAAVGLSLPGTSKEDEMMGETRDQLMERGKQTAQDTKERAQRALEEGQRAAQEEAERQDLK